MTDKPGRIQAENNHRHHGQLHQHSFLPNQGQFSASDLHAGTVFTAELDRLLESVQAWDRCRAAFAEKLSGTTLPTKIQDGSGPVAHAVGTRFSHRIGTAGGIGYAAHVYVQRLEQILEGLIQTAQGYAHTEETSSFHLNNGGA
jgi:hypothetical protein